MLLSKGFEIEMYTGTPAGEIIGFSDRIVKDLDGFVREPDKRNVEYTTAPFCRYEQLLCAIVKPRLKLRDYLKNLGEYTILPGSTLSLGDSRRFYRSDPNNPYHDYIEHTYGTDVVTASIHINIGIDDPEILMQACRLIRLEAPLFLALSASSPFLDNQLTGFHSYRWQIFPQTPAYVPLFSSHQHYIDWTEEQLKLGTMQNVRHLWCSVRPNGDCRPYRLNRLELRICDLVTDPFSLLAITALLEARIIQLQNDPNLDPLKSSYLIGDNASERLVAMAIANEKAASKNSLEAKLIHWQTGEYILTKDWLEEMYSQTLPIAKSNGFSCFLSPLKKIIQTGNTAQKWLALARKGLTISQILRQEIAFMEEEDKQLETKICADYLVA